MEYTKNIINKCNNQIGRAETKNLLHKNLTEKHFSEKRNEK